MLILEHPRAASWVVAATAARSALLLVTPWSCSVSVESDCIVPHESPMVQAPIVAHELPSVRQTEHPMLVPQPAAVVTGGHWDDTGPSECCKTVITPKW